MTLDKGIMIDSTVVNISRGLCPCGKTLLTPLFTDIISNKTTIDVCPKCGGRLPEINWDDYEC